MGTRVRVGDTEFELGFDLSPDDPLPPGVEWVEESIEAEGDRPAGVLRQLVTYAKELAISPDYLSHWIAFFTEHPYGQLAWEEIRFLWKATPRPQSK